MKIAYVRRKGRERYWSLFRGGYGDLRLPRHQQQQQHSHATSVGSGGGGGRGGGYSDCDPADDDDDDDDEERCEHHRQHRKHHQHQHQHLQQRLGQGATRLLGGGGMNVCRLVPRAGGARRALLVLIVLFSVMGCLLYTLGILCTDTTYTSEMITNEKYVISSDKKVYMYNRHMPLIFIGGVPRSGTTLMRAMLDAHPEVRCGQETRVIPRLLQMRSHWMKSEKESVRLKEAGISKEVLDSAIAAFCLEVIARHGEPAPRLCNKDPLTIKMGTYVVDLFPNAKFIFMIRDGRATVHSIVSRQVTITGFDLTSYRQCLRKWNQAVELMNNQCKALGPERCLPVPYEQLVLHPRIWMKKILSFLDVPWNESVLHHEEFINKPNGISLSKVERSSDQVIKPVNLEALTKWVGHIPEDVLRDMADIAPMLSILGYDPYMNPPNYGKPDSQVADNTRQVKNNAELWQARAREMFKPSNQFEGSMMEDVVSEGPDGGG